MQLRPNKSNPAPQNNSGPAFRKLHPGKQPYGAKLKKPLQKERLNEADLEQLRLDILQSEKTRHYRVLLVSILLIIVLGLAIYWIF